MYQAHKSKKDNNYIGKIGEIATAKFLATKGIHTSVDLKVHHYSNDGGADLTFVDHGRTFYVHVKTQKIELALRHCISWSFQASDYRYETYSAKQDRLIEHAKNSKEEIDVVITVLYSDDVDENGFSYAYICHKVTGMEIKKRIVEGTPKVDGKKFLLPEELSFSSIVARNRFRIFAKSFASELYQEHSYWKNRR